MNPNYKAYAKAHGKTPEEMMAQDEKAYPGGRMAGFLHWMLEMKEKFRQDRPECFLRWWDGGKCTGTLLDYDAWARYLQEQADKPRP